MAIEQWWDDEIVGTIPHMDEVVSNEAVSVIDSLLGASIKRNCVELQFRNVAQ